MWYMAAPELQDAMELDNDSDSEVSLYEGEGASVRSASVISGDGADWRTAVVPPAPLALEAEHASDTEQADPPTATPAPSSAPAATPRPRSPRKGSGAWLHAKRLEPVKEGHDMSVLQAAYSIAEIKSGGAPNAVCDKVCQYSSRMLLKESLHPQSYHMVKAVLGVEDAADFEFAWCPTCAWRYPPPAQGHQHSLDETCPRCGDDKNEVCAWSVPERRLVKAHACDSCFASCAASCAFLRVHLAHVFQPLCCP